MIKVGLDKYIGKMPDSQSIYTVAEMYNNIAPMYVSATDKRISITPQGLWKYVKNESIPDIIVTTILADCLGVTIDKLISDNPCGTTLEELFIFTGEDRKHIGRMARKLRDGRDISRAVLAEKVGVSRTTIELIENGSDKIKPARLLMYMRNLGLQPYIKRTIAFRDALPVYYANEELGRKNALISLYKRDSKLTLCDYSELLGVGIQDVMSLWSRLVVEGILPEYTHNENSVSDGDYKRATQFINSESTYFDVARRTDFELSVVGACWLKAVRSKLVKWNVIKYDGTFTKSVKLFNELVTAEPELTDFDLRVLLGGINATKLYRIKTVVSVANTPTEKPVNPLVYGSFRDVYKHGYSYKDIKEKTDLSYVQIGRCFKKALETGIVNDKIL